MRCEISHTFESHRCCQGDNLKVIDCYIKKLIEQFIWTIQTLFTQPNLSDIMHYALCIMHYALCTMHCALCIMCYVLSGQMAAVWHAACGISHKLSFCCSHGSTETVLSSHQSMFDVFLGSIMDRNQGKQFQKYQIFKNLEKLCNHWKRGFNSFPLIVGFLLAAVEKMVCLKKVDKTYFISQPQF